MTTGRICYYFFYIILKNTNKTTKKTSYTTITKIKQRILFEYSKKKQQRIIKNTPAVTIVAACNKALTGVGPSIASGNKHEK
jgi:hypothetical protein